MKRTHIAAMLLGFTLSSAAGLANAQYPTSNNAQPTPMTMERAEFLKMFTYDTVNDMWIMSPGMAPPVGIRSRAEVKAERDMFLSMNRYDNATSKWIPLTGTPRNMSTMTREEVRAETAAYLRTHRYDEQTSKWEARTTGGSQ